MNDDTIKKILKISKFIVIIATVITTIILLIIYVLPLFSSGSTSSQSIFSSCRILGDNCNLDSYCCDDLICDQSNGLCVEKPVEDDEDDDDDDNDEEKLKTCNYSDMPVVSNGLFTRDSNRTSTIPSGDSLNLTCNSGFRLSTTGSSSIRCNNGNWTWGGVAGQCLSTTTPGIPTPTPTPTGPEPPFPVDFHPLPRPIDDVTILQISEV